MILYFSGTGNSEYIAKLIGKEIDDEVINLFSKIKDHDYSTVKSDKPWVIVVPTYAWQIPHIVRDWIINADLQGSKDVYFILTCGSSIGNAQCLTKKLCEKKSLNHMGCIGVVMPENYIAMFNAPDVKEAREIIAKAVQSLPNITDCISQNKPLNVKKPNFIDKISTTIVNKFFYKFSIKDKSFRIKDNCTSCGLCERVCPMANIKLTKGKPVWNGNCTHCMACICSCPAKAIEYGNKTKKKVRYQCPQDIE